MKVQFNKFLLGNYSDQCPNDCVEVNGERSGISDLFPASFLPNTSVTHGRIQDSNSDGLKLDFDMTVVTCTGQVYKDPDMTTKVIQI